MRKLAIQMNIIIVFMLLATCGADQREQTIKTALGTVNEARNAFLALDGSLQLKIVQAATTRAEGVLKLEAYRHARENVVKVFELAYRAIATAAIVNGDPKSFPAMLVALRDLKAAIDNLSKGFGDE